MRHIAAVQFGRMVLGARRFSPLSEAFGQCASCVQLWIRHAVDTDYIAAIDNVTRKLM
jgi:high-affinity nickel permease